MSELETRRTNLLRRIERKRQEICRYLDNQFYNIARGILQSIREADSTQTFESNPSVLPEYLAYVHRPMYWGLIHKKLTHYEYNTSAEFVSDMRLVVDNCYTYNKHSSPFSAVARDLEVRMEDEFVKQLGIPPPDLKELIRLGSHLPRETSSEVWKVISRYEKMTERPQGTRVHVSPAKYACATQRRIIALLRQAAFARAQHAASKNNKAVNLIGSNNNINNNNNIITNNDNADIEKANLAGASQESTREFTGMTHSYINNGVPVNSSSSQRTFTRDMLATTTTTTNFAPTHLTNINNNTNTSKIDKSNPLLNNINISNSNNFVEAFKRHHSDDEIEFHEEPQLAYSSPDNNLSKVNDALQTTGVSTTITTTNTSATTATTVLERVPQNARSLNDDVRIVSPVNLEDYNSDEFPEEHEEQERKSKQHEQHV